MKSTNNINEFKYNYDFQFRGDLITTFKILHSMIDTDSKIFVEQSTSVTRGHSLKLFKFASSSSLRKNYFSNREINE